MLSQHLAVFSTHTRLTAIFPELPRWASTRKVKPIWVLLKQDTVSDSGISWAICKSAPRSRQITMPAPHHSVFTGRMPFLPPNQQRQSTGKCAVKWISKIPPHLAYIATLPCETLMSATQAIDNKLRGSVATYWRCDGVANNQIRRGLLLSLSVNFLCKSVSIWQSYKNKRVCLVHFLRHLALCWPGAQSAWDNRALACNFAKHSPIVKKIHSQTQH